MNRLLASKWAKLAVFLLGMAPAVIPVWQAFRVIQFHVSPLDYFTANPIEFITHYTGDWTLRFLLITLTITPLRGILNAPAITRHRRMIGLYAFFYGCLHLLTWVWPDRGFSPSGMWEDVIERTYITVGMVAFLAMVPLAATSTAGWVRRLGFRRWKRVHRLIYLSALAGCIHYLWLVKSDIRLPLMYIAILAGLFGYRLVVKARESVKAQRRKTERSRPAAQETAS